MTQRLARYTQNLAVIANQPGPFGINLVANIRQQGISQVILKTAAIDGGVQA